MLERFWGVREAAGFLERLLLLLLCQGLWLLAGIFLLGVWLVVWLLLLLARHVCGFGMGEKVQVVDIRGWCVCLLSLCRSEVKARLVKLCRG